MASKVDAELQRIELVSEPDDKENELREKLQDARDDSSIMPDQQALYDLGCHLIDKNRPEEAIELLLESIAIDRNWNDR